MAQRRMFSIKIVESAKFLKMPASSQGLYFHLCLRADDNGFINCPKAIMRVLPATEGDMDILIAKKFITSVESGGCMVNHWNIHNNIQT